MPISNALLRQIFLLAAYKRYVKNCRDRLGKIYGSQQIISDGSVFWETEDGSTFKGKKRDHVSFKKNVCMKIV